MYACNKYLFLLQKGSHISTLITPEFKEVSQAKDIRIMLEKSLIVIKMKDKISIKIFNDFIHNNKTLSISTFLCDNKMVTYSNNNNEYIDEHIFLFMEEFIHCYMNKANEYYNNAFQPYDEFYEMVTVWSAFRYFFSITNGELSIYIYDEKNNLINHGTNKVIQRDQYIDLINKIKSNGHILHNELLESLNCEAISINKIQIDKTIKLQNYNDFDNSYYSVVIKSDGIYLVNFYDMHNGQYVCSSDIVYKNIAFLNYHDIQFITETIVISKKYDKNNTFCTFHDLTKLSEKDNKEFKRTFSCSVLDNNTKIAEINLCRMLWLSKDEIFKAKISLLNGDNIILNVQIKQKRMSFNTIKDIMKNNRYYDKTKKEIYTKMVIVCGLGEMFKWLTGNKSSSSSKVSVTQQTYGSTGTTVHHNGQLVYKENSGTIVANKMKIGKVDKFPTIVYKVAQIIKTHEKCIVKLRLPEDTIFIRSHSTSNIMNSHLFSGKRRCNKAIVLAILKYNLEKEIEIHDAVAESCYFSKKIFYKVGTIVYPDIFDHTSRECSNGIHVFEKLHYTQNLDRSLIEPKNKKKYNCTKEIIDDIMPLEAKRISILNEINKAKKQTKIIKTSIDQTMQNLNDELFAIDQQIAVNKNEYDNCNYENDENDEVNLLEADEVQAVLVPLNGSLNRRTNTNTYSNIPLAEAKIISPYTYQYGKNNSNNQKK